MRRLAWIEPSPGHPDQKQHFSLRCPTRGQCRLDFGGRRHGASLFIIFDGDARMRASMQRLLKSIRGGP
jgi:hypothetical protein